MRSRILLIGVACLVVVAACGDGGGGADTTESGDTATTSGEGGPEVDSLTVITASRDAGSNGPFIIGTGKGFFAEEGLEVEVAISDDPRPALVGDSAQVAVLEVPYTAQAVAEDIDLVAFAGFRCVEPYMIGVQPDMDSVEDLAGENVFLNGVPGDPVVDYRLSLMADAGWDMSTVDVEYVQISGDNLAWVEQWTTGAIAVTPFYREDLPVLEEHGVNVVVNELISWPNEVMVAKRSFVEENPETVERFVRGMLKSVAWYSDLDNKDEFLEMARTQDYPVEQAERDYASGPYLFCENLYVSVEEANRQLEVQQVPGSPDFADFSLLDGLKAAQESMGLDNEPPSVPPDPNLGLEDAEG